MCTAQLCFFASWLFFLSPFYEAFRSLAGFLVGGQALELFRPQELEVWVCGTPHLEQNCRYEGGYGPGTRWFCRWFWYLAKEDIGLEEKKQLLKFFHFFITGSR